MPLPVSRSLISASSAATVHHPGGQVGHRGVPVAGEALREVEGGVEALARRGGHGDHPVPRQVGEHRLLGRRRGQHLVACVPDQTGQQLGVPFVAHDETRFVMRINFVVSVPLDAPGPLP